MGAQAISRKGRIANGDAVRITAQDIASLEVLAELYKPRSKPWSKAEVDLLMRFFGRVEHSVLAAKLGRSIDAIQQKAYGMRGRKSE